MNLMSDVGIVILYQSSIWSLQMTFWRKVHLSAVFILGFWYATLWIFAMTILTSNSACFASLARVVISIETVTTIDNMYWTWTASLLSTVEVTIGFIVACTPVAPKFFQWLRNKISLRSSGRGLERLRDTQGSDRRISHPHVQNYQYFTPVQRQESLAGGDRVIPLTNVSLKAPDPIAASKGSIYVTHSIDIENVVQLFRMERHPWYQIIQRGPRVFRSSISQ